MKKTSSPDSKRPLTPARFFTVFLLSLLLVAALIIGSFYASGQGVLSPESVAALWNRLTGKKSISPEDWTLASNAAVVFWEDAVAAADTTGFYFLTSTGKEIVSYATSWQEPLFRVVGEQCLLFDQAQGKLLLANKDKILWQPEFSDLSYASLSSAGIGVVGEEESSLGYVAAYSTKGKLLTEVSFSDIFPIGALLSNDGSSLLSWGLREGELSYTGVLLFYSVKGGECLQEIPLENSIPLDIRETEEGDFLLVTDTGLMKVTSAGETFLLREFSSSATVSAFDFAGEYIFLLLTEEYGSCTLLTLGYDGNLLGEKALPLTPEGYAVGESLVLRSGNELTLYSPALEILREKTYPDDAVPGSLWVISTEKVVLVSGGQITVWSDEE